MEKNMPWTIHPKQRQNCMLHNGSHCVSAPLKSLRNQEHILSLWGKNIWAVVNCKWECTYVFTCKHKHIKKLSIPLKGEGGNLFSVCVCVCWGGGGERTKQKFYNGQKTNAEMMHFSLRKVFFYGERSHLERDIIKYLSKEVMMDQTQSN